MDGHQYIWQQLNLDIVKLLASKVEHPNIPLPDGRTPLFLSVRHGHKDITKFIGSKLKKRGNFWET